MNLYEAVAVGAALAYLKNGTINTEVWKKWIKDSELIKYTTGATNTKERVIKRIEYCKNKLRDKVLFDEIKNELTQGL